ncbi:steryl-sulfatase-like [Rhopilema esculentum]|uniref:steryl-sulfatase-like n=1 Tax=Rhopilema esculentum TaxID=499914 RepID=UPI0031D546AE|eukprot:gene15569-6836_t
MNAGMCSSTTIFLVCTFLALLSSVFGLKIDPQKPQNFVILMVDDLGIGDVGCFGNDTIKTPNIDKLASEGVKLEHGLAAAPVCTPSRAAFLTGRYAVRSGMVGWPNDNKVLVRTALTGGLPSEEVTFAKILKQHGYKTAFVGKWHLGMSCNTSKDFCHHPKNHGFSHFYGLPHTNQRECADNFSPELNDFDKMLKTLFTSFVVIFPALIALTRFGMIKVAVVAFLLLSYLFVIYVPEMANIVASNWFDCILMRGKEVVEQPINLGTLTHRLTSDATEFIEKHQDDPFLLFMSFAKVHTALKTSENFVNHSKHGRYGDNVEEMDWAVGKILSKIEELGLFDDTMVYFTSDHGPHLEEVARDGEMCGGFQGIFKGGKGTNWEGGIRVPTIARWPKRIPPGTKTDVPTSSLDFFPTVLKVAGIKVPENRVLDGEDILEVLTGKASDRFQERFIFHYCDAVIQAVTFADNESSKVWKIHYITPQFSPGTEACMQHFLCPCFGEGVNIHDPPLVFDLGSDPGEKSPLDTNTAVIRRLLRKTKSAVERHNLTIQAVPSQLSSRAFLPWMQLCCNPPFCSCKENFPFELIPFD